MIEKKSDTRKLLANILALDSAITHINYLCSVKYNLKETSLKEASVVTAENISKAIITMQPMIDKTEEEMQIAYTKPNFKDYNVICNVESLKNKCEDSIRNVEIYIGNLHSKEVIFDKIYKRNDAEFIALRSEIENMDLYLHSLKEVKVNCERFLEFFEN